MINTAQNGAAVHGYGYKRHQQLRQRAGLHATTTTRCVTLGIPPTTDVANARWGLSARRTRTDAAAHVDGYMWFGRPWLYMQADPFVKSRALALARTTPW